MVWGFVPPEDNGMSVASNTLGFRIRALACLAMIASSATAIGCGPGQDTGVGAGPIGTSSGGFGGDGGTGGDGCPEGATRDCQIDLGKHENVHSCFDGVQTCKDGTWGACIGATKEPPAPPPAARRGTAGGKKTLSLSSPVDCASNDCDPSCQEFTEVPGSPVGSPPENLIAQWAVGGYGSLPSSVLSAGVSEPCDLGEDCQFDQYCDNPVSGTCSHHKCITGSGLVSGCDPCVQKICAIDSSCCTTTVGSCSHDLCQVGASLQKTNAAMGITACDSCVDTVCGAAAYNYCCDTTTPSQWDMGCVERVVNNCGQSCTSGTWSSTCVDLVSTHCGAFCLEGTTCAHDKCYLGDALSSACDPCVAKVCAVTPSCCSGGAGAWTGECLGLVATECPEDPCPAKGTCVPWLPTETDPDCGNYDVTIGVGCMNGATPQVPVCNRGNTDIPSGIPITVFPSAPTLIPSCTPNVASGTTVTTTSVIAPGKCINVALPVGTADGSQVMANASGATGYDANECQYHCSNNWSVFTSAAGSCATPVCTGASAFSKLKKLKMFFTVDISTSMNKSVVTAVANTEPMRWTLLKTALQDFMDAAETDTAVWMEFWPSNTNGGNPACPFPYLGSLGCGSSPGCGDGVGNAINVADLVGGNLTTVKNAIVGAVPGGPPWTFGGSTTPLYPALEGALRAATTFQAANTDYTAVVIVVTDGAPNSCITTSSKLAALSSAAFNSYGVRTYTIGLPDVVSTTLTAISGAGGGKTFIVPTSSQAQFQSDLASAFAAIKSDFVSCSFELPNEDIFDPDQASVTYTPGSGGIVIVPQVANKLACAGDGWYYDDPADPTSITLCDTTCNSVKADSNGEIEISIDCISQYLPSQYKQTYEAVCPAGTVVQWGQFTYDTTTPGDSYVEFRAHTSDTMVFGSPPSSAMAVASIANGEDCELTNPTPCWVDLFDELGKLPAARRRYLELIMDIYPTSDTNSTPEVNDWQVTYSCPDAE